MIRKIRLVKDAVDIIIPKNYSRKELKKIKSEEIETDKFQKSLLGKIKALMSLRN
jgi:hypothetical protein